MMGTERCSIARALAYILFLSIFVVSAQSVKYEDCEATMCSKSGPTISYPFYVAGSGQELCGYPGFKVRCEGGEIMYGGFLIRRIVYEKQSFRLATRYMNDTGCFVPNPYTSYHYNLFQKSSSHYYLKFFYGCTDTFSTDMPQSRLSCTSDQLNYTFVVLTHGEEWPQQKNGSCHSYSRVPVELKEGIPIPTINSVDYRELLKDGFALNWTLLTNKGCAKCIHSGGRCGRSNDKDFVCYCSDGSSHENCDAGVEIGGSVIAACLFIYMIYLRRKDVSPKFHLKNITPCPSLLGPDMEESSVHFEFPIFTSSELREATNHFASSHELADRGFRAVYYRKLRDESEVAVKRLYRHSYCRVRRFMNEVEILTRLWHNNLMPLYGCTSCHSHELLLVYEYTSNGIVANHIQGQQANSPATLPWRIIMNIAIEIATALTYLHASDMIHCDVKANNILLDDDFGIKVADFGLLRLFPNDVSYLSSSSRDSRVILIELMLSMRAVDITGWHKISLANFAINKIQTCAFGESINRTLGFELAGFPVLAAGQGMRPSMDEVLEELKAIARDENAANKSFDVDEGEGALAPSPMGNDDVQLLKNLQLTHSPVSVAKKWASRRSGVLLPLLMFKFSL
ncbi:hypothetical protein ACJRO7_012186 [Eucalyptus globulus]|uniref:non-specific serine/threonine protein kinase n=1 Tax=Eucalyptus globulus TaxID=34317 RepID=A0ABD3LHS0_EUCGL